MLLALPDIRQQTPYSCGDAAIQIALQFHRIVASSKLATPIDGLDPAGLERHLRRLGLSVSAGSATLDDLAHYCNTSRPPIALVTWSEDSESHWVVVRGVSRGRVYFQDPSDGPQSVKLGAWGDMWHGAGRLGEKYSRWSVVAWPYASRVK